LNPIHKYYSNAKLLLTGEYLVLHGALAFAVPLQYGQMLEVYKTNTENLEWIALENGDEWLKFEISEEDIFRQSSKGTSDKEFVCYLLNRARSLNPRFLQRISYQIKTEIDFNRNWGLGSSSSLINNVAQWADVNPYELHALISNGSGYDIACANYCKPILFRKNGVHPMIYPVDFDPSFTSQLYFVYLGKKQISEDSVNQFLGDYTPQRSELEKISLLSKRVLQAQDPYEFDKCIMEHERFVGDAINQEPIQEKMFGDFNGTLKSLGAWGGDFMLARTDIGKREVSRYFFEKGLTTIFRWDEIVLGTH
jgi:mevalonate kinase